MDIASFPTQVPPRPLQLHALSSRLARRLKENYNISVPEANAAHVLCRSVEALHLPGSRYSLRFIYVTFNHQHSCTLSHDQGFCGHVTHSAYPPPFVVIYGHECLWNNSERTNRRQYTSRDDFNLRSSSPPETLIRSGRSAKVRIKPADTVRWLTSL
jgi:hypothetical protein